MTKEDKLLLWVNTAKLVEKNSDLLMSLYMRWQDEREYEDFEQYKQRIAKEFDTCELVSFKKRPFSFTIKLPEGMPSMLVKITQKGGYATLEWKRA